MMHAAAGAVSAASSNASGAPAPALPRYHRYSSRSNSLSSASVVTIKRTGSLSSTSTGARASTIAMGTQSETALIALRVKRDSGPQNEHKRRRSAAMESWEQVHGASTEGLNNLNRWSQSTDSSAASLNNARRSRGSGGATLQSLATIQSSPQKKVNPTIEHSPRSSAVQPKLRSHAAPSKRPSSPVPPEELRRRASRADLQRSLTALPPLHITPALTDPNDNESPSTIPTIKTPSTQSFVGHDYLGNDTTSPRSAAKGQRTLMVRNYTGPISRVDQARTLTEEPEGHHLTRSRVSEMVEVSPRTGTALRDNHGQRRSRTEKDRKAMLSKALQKANTAVLLDNAQNFEGALEAYNDACRLLKQVMDRSPGTDDKRKLEAIRVTYTNRIEELNQLEMSRPSTAEGKTLPARPMSGDSINLDEANPTSPVDASLDDSTIVGPIDANAHPSTTVETATAQRPIDIPQLLYPDQDRDSFFSRTMEAVDTSAQHSQMTDQERQKEIPEMPRRPSPELPPNLTADVQRAATRELPRLDTGPSEHAKTETQPVAKARTLGLPPSKGSAYMPAALSPRKSPSSPPKPEAERAWQPEPQPQLHHDPVVAPTSAIDDSFRERANSTNSTSCALGRISIGVRERKHIRGDSDGVNLDFDAAFDAAVEAAYNEGLEPDLEGRGKRETVYRHATKDSIVVRNSEIREVLSPTNEFRPANRMDSQLDDEDEERLLDEITQDFGQGFNFDLTSKSALPRQSDSSGYSGSTWQSSQASVDRATAASSLSTVAEDTLPVLWSEKLASTPSSVNTLRAEQPPPAAPPPTSALPRPPSMSGNRLSSVRSRRLSGQIDAKQLKIETDTKPAARKRASTFHHSPGPKQAEQDDENALDRDFKFGTAIVPTLSDPQHELILESPPSLDMPSAISDSSQPLTSASIAESRSSSIDETPAELRTAKPAIIRRNKSSMSLREHSILLPSPDTSAPSIATPMSSTYMTFQSKRTRDPLTLQRATFPQSGAMPTDAQHASGGVYLFDTSLSASRAPASPRSPTSSEACVLEPCPESTLLRPFWLMRAISATLTHPRGGFLTTRLFVPREVWQTRGVKLKSVEDKVANCDLLTAALGRLAGVDTYDADAVMAELQSFEEVMERVQLALAKKLGSEVGVGGTSGFFRDAASGGTFSSAHGLPADAIAGTEKGGKGKEGKGYLNSWRKLRSKSSGIPLTLPQLNRVTGEKESTSMASVPMTSFIPVERRGKRNDARTVAFEGPNRDYMGSLARLFEGVEVLDQIARQVEDPGLKHSSPTHVGLELSMRHAAEFFAFYVCRFVLADLGTLVDKFVKRGTEWVLA